MGYCLLLVFEFLPVVSFFAAAPVVMEVTARTDFAKVSVTVPSHATAVVPMN